MAAGQRDERIDRLDHAGAGGPAAADARRRARRRRPRPGGSPLAEPRPRPAGMRLVRRAIRSESSTSRMSRSTGRRFRARPIRPRWRSSRSCSCWTGSKPFSRRIALGLPRPTRAAVASAAPRVTGKRLLIIVRKTRSSSPVSRAVVGEVVDVGLAKRVERRRPRGDHPGDLERVVARGHHRPSRRSSSVGEGPLGVDPEVVDDRLHGEGQGVVERAP